MRTTSRRLKRLIEEEEKTLSRIAQQQEYLKEIREARKKEEDLEIIRSIRSMRLGARELLDLLTGIQDGTVSMEMREALLKEAESGEDLPDPEEEKGMPDDGEAGTDAGPSPDQKRAGRRGPEREENNDEHQD